MAVRQALSERYRNGACRSAITASLRLQFSTQILQPTFRINHAPDVNALGEEMPGNSATWMPVFQEFSGGLALQAACATTVRRSSANFEVPGQAT